MSQGNLVLSATKEAKPLKTLVLTATASDKTTCQATIDYTLYNRTDWNIYVADPTKVKIPLPSLIVFPSSSSFMLSGLATGPNLNYRIDEAAKTFLAVPTKQVLSTYQYWPLKIENKTYPIATDVIFSDTISVEDDNAFMQAIQTKDNVVTIWRC